MFCAAANLFAGQADPRDDFRNFYGISWRNSPADNLAYARQMGYRYVFYQSGMEKLPQASGMRFYLESPEYSAYERTINPSKKYSPAQIRDFETARALANTTEPFPKNIATGWFFANGSFSTEPDYQQKKVTDAIVAKIISKVKKIEAANPKFRFAGFAWDVPQPAGDFWTPATPNKRRAQVTLAVWTGKDSGAKHPDAVHDYATYSAGKLAYYRTLLETARAEIAPDAKFIVEPYKPESGWFKYMRAYPDALRADLICQESAGTEFLDDKNVVGAEKIWDVSRMMSTTPNVFDEPSARNIAARAAVAGAWTGWYGRFGGTGNMPDYKSIREVPARLKLVKALPVWENMNSTPLSARSWKGGVYKSPTAFISADAVAALQYGTNKFFAVFNTPAAKVVAPDGYRVKSVFKTDELFIENGSADGEVFVKDNVISPTASAVGKGYIVELEKL